MTHVKLGAFALAALSAAVIAVVALGVGGRGKVVRYHTYFDESIQGLDVGAPVDYRGVAIGSVGAIIVAPDQRLIDVALDIREADAPLVTRADLRAQLANQGITGLKFVDIDRSDSPALTLAFIADARYVPSRPSLFVGLETLAPKLSTLVDRSTTAIDHLGKLAEHADAALAHLRGVDELIAHVRHAVDSFGELGRGASGTTGQLEQTLREIGDAARSFHELVDDVERDPDMLVKGRARS